MKIVPALLTDKKEYLAEMVKVCAKFTDYVQIDIMDGEFVPSKSVKLSDLHDLKLPIDCEAHLMVSEPAVWIEPFKRIGAKKIIYHFEIEEVHSEIIHEIKKRNLAVGIAVNPSTEIDEFRYLLNDIDTVLFMSVNPGFYGAEFIPGVLEKIMKFKKEYPEKNAAIDGGIKFDNLLNVRDSGVDYICVGSAILKDDNPEQAYLKFLNLLA